VWVGERAGLKLAVAGVIDPQRVEHVAWESVEPVAAVMEVFRGLDADVKIVLAYFDEAGLRQLAHALPEVDYIIGGPTGQTVTPTRVGGVTILSATNKGKYLVDLQLGRGNQATSQEAAAHRGAGFEKSAGIMEVRSVLSEDRWQLGNLRDYYAQLAQRDFSAEEAGLVEPWLVDDPQYAIAGSASCGKCHAGDTHVWTGSKHAHAWDVLTVKGAQADPYCQQCHTTGYGLPGGFRSIAQTLDAVHVGCENCHGPSAAHVADPRVRTPLLAKQQCIGCHDHENSPGFAMDAYWARIFHGPRLPSETAP
jgi:hypothetical protein